MNLAQNNMEGVLYSPLTLTLTLTLTLSTRHTGSQASLRSAVPFVSRKGRGENSEVFSTHFTGKRKCAFTLAEVFSTHFAGQRKAAFTLAEVLITLGIIGVVAAMTLPALVQNYRNRELETGLKSAYSILQQGLQKMQAEQGFPPVPANYCVNGSFYADYKKYFNKIIDCGFLTPNEDVCMSRNNNHGNSALGLYDLTYKTFNGKSQLGTGIFDDGQFVLPNGMLIIIENNSCTLLLISVDVNGKKKGPNRLGQDLFTFQLMSDGKLLPSGAAGTTYTNCSSSSTSNLNGTGCAYKALTEKDFFKNLPK